MYILLAGATWYPTGPYDYKGTFTDIESAEEAGEQRLKAWDDWYAIIDQGSGEIVSSKGNWYGKSKWEE